MRYVKIKATYKYAPDRLYRVLLVPEKCKLSRLAKIIGDSFHFEWEHMFQFRKGQNFYVMDPEDEDTCLFGNDALFDMDEFTVGDLGEKAVFEYDFGEGWEFDLRIYKRIVEKDEDCPALLLEGAGQGIWEDNISTLDRYLAGEITEPVEDFDALEEEGISLPWNFQNSTFSDFDEPLDIVSEQEYLDIMIEDDFDFEDDEFDEDDDEYCELPDDELEAFDLIHEKLKMMDHLGKDDELHQYVLKLKTELSRRYKEPIASLLLHQMLMDEIDLIEETIEL